MQLALFHEFILDFKDVFMTILDPNETTEGGF